MAKYANKTCYDCAVVKPANEMYRVTESYKSGRSDRRPDAANVAGFLFSDAKTSRKMIKGAFTKNNRRVYTRNRTVWKCGSCSGHTVSVERVEQKPVQRVEPNLPSMSAKEAVGGLMIFINFLLMLASGAFTAFCVVGAALLAANSDFEHMPTIAIMIAFTGSIFALTLYKFRQ